jgi:hypothetical protein
MAYATRAYSTVLRTALTGAAKRPGHRVTYVMAPRMVPTHCFGRRQSWHVLKPGNDLKISGRIGGGFLDLAVRLPLYLSANKLNE